MYALLGERVHSSECVCVYLRYCTHSLCNLAKERKK